MQTMKHFEGEKESFRSFIVTVVCVDVMLSSLSSGQTDIPNVGCQILFLFVPLGLLSVLKKNLWLDKRLSANIVFCFYLAKNRILKPFILCT
ncbi:hypothetical protein DAPPUDRAFT_305825 [Daphnia pulex]|uniref:Uncharacterized protein n=1 Tax=Daphnia pulex TaxID=6669 RepID=E9GT81_DAPPU|nr:hypothetical protein DAPPUDRAFT_305825 [Daphnia pulex]|eukprot:EFX77232.1 hypothetical protein DAPPUDRAFT_305825 [Daphnia pulex]